MATVHTNLTVGKTYAVTSANGCTVTLANGVEVTLQAGQDYFTPDTPEVTVSDDTATVVQTFNRAPSRRGGGGVTPYSRLEHRGGYVFEAWYDTLDYRAADRWMERHAPAVLGGCSSIARNGIFGRTFDWLYDESAVLVVHTPAANGYHATLGVCGEVPGLTRDAALAGGASVFAVAPFLLVDGGNDAGLCASTNVVPHNAYGDNSRVVVDPDAPAVCTLEVVRYMLDHFATVDEAAAWFTSTNFYHPVKLVAGGYEQHWLVTDGANTAAFEFIDGVARVVPLASTATFLTNFHVYGVTPNEDGSVLTPTTNTAHHTAVEINHIHPLGCGLERWNIINAGLDSAGSKAGMASLLDTLRFTRAYAGHAGTASPRWDTEWCGIEGLRCNMPSSSFDAVQEAQGALYAARVRGDGKTWQTVHASVYEAATASLTLRAQEEDTDYEFVLETGGGQIVIDPEPTQGSENAVSSGGVYAALREPPAPVPEPLGTTTTLLHGHVYTLTAEGAETDLSALRVEEGAAAQIRLDYVEGAVTLPEWVWPIYGEPATWAGGMTYLIAVYNEGRVVLANVETAYNTPTS